MVPENIRGTDPAKTGLKRGLVRHPFGNGSAQSSDQAMFFNRCNQRGKWKKQKTGAHYPMVLRCEGSLPWQKCPASLAQGLLRVKWEG